MALSEIHPGDTVHLTSRGHTDKSVRLILEALLFPHLNKNSEFSDQKVKRGPLKRSINSCSSTHQLHIQITDTEKLVWMSTGRYWALKTIRKTNQKDCF